MKVKELVEKYNELNNATLKENLLKERVKQDTYVPYTTKMAICKGIADATTRREMDVDGKEVKYLYSDSANRYILFMHRILKEYTDLELVDNPAEAITDFELLDQYGFIDRFVELVPEKEYANFQVILDMYVNDNLTNDNNLINYFDNKINATKMALDSILSVIETFMTNEEIANLTNKLTDNKENKDGE